MTQAVRERAQALLARARRGESDWFTIDDGQLAEATRLTVDVTRRRYPDGKIPLHSRWRHFQAGEVDRLAELARLLGPHASPPERTRAQIDLAVISVLLDAGAGAAWRYDEAGSGQRFTRSEGLAIASFHAFTAGLFSSDPQQPLQADAAGLQALDADRLGAAFQVSDGNPLVGLAGRTTLLHRLGAATAAQPRTFGPLGRPGGLFDAVLDSSSGAATTSIQAQVVFDQVMQSLSRIWPSAHAIDDSTDPTLALGDCWRHSAVRGPGLTDGWMPFHKLSQWLTYSLLEPFQWAGIEVGGLDALTGLPEYRNGGLFIDCGVIRPKDPAAFERSWKVGDEFIVEWRALTVALLDELAIRVREQMKHDEADLPLAAILEGGTWAAGRELAQRLRDGAPPLKIESDGTVF